jgi:hypothetical protein
MQMLSDYCHYLLYKHLWSYLYIEMAILYIMNWRKAMHTMDQ